MTTARPLHLMGATVVPLATGDDTDGTHEAFRLDLAPGAASPLHTIPGSKLFVVLDGDVTIVDGDVAGTHGVGEAVLVPAGTPHRYANESDRDARVLVVTSGTDQLAFLAGMADLAAGGKPDPEALRRHTQQHGVRILQPA